jgi:hypothetical protein
MCAEHLQNLMGLEIKEATNPAWGLGMFTTVTREKGENICQYDGKVIIDLTADSSDEDEDHKPVHGPYVLQIKKHPPTYIDGARSTNLGRWVNSAKGLIVNGKPVRNNTQLIYNAATKKAWVRATRDIGVGEELLSAYGSGYWRG